MMFISGGRGGSSAASSSSADQPAYTYSGGVRIISPDGVNGAPHFVVEAPQAPLGTWLLDLSTTAEQPMEVMWAQGRFVADSLIFERPDGAVGSATVTIKTLDAARGGGRTLANAQSLAALGADRKAIVQVPLSLGVWLKSAFLYATVANAGTGTVRVSLFGRILEMDDPEARTYGRRRLDRVT